MMPLALADSGEENIIRKIGGSPEVKKHLEDLGFVVGDTVTVVTTLNGNVIVKVKERWYAIKVFERDDMTAFLAANLSTILICIVLIAIVVSISIYLVRQKKQGKSSCGAGCAHCAMHGECHSCRK